jgi:hypothetical protein
MILPLGSSLIVTTDLSFKGVESGSNRSRNCSLYIWSASAGRPCQSTKELHTST